MLNIFSESKIRRCEGISLAVVLSCMSLYAVQGEGLQWNKLIPALLLSVLAGILLTMKIEFKKILGIVMFLALPLASLCAMEFFTHVPWDLKPPILLLNYLFYLILYAVCTAAFGSSRWGAFAAPFLPMIVGTINYFVVQFRPSPIMPWDIYSAGTAMSIADNYTFSMSYRLLFVLIGFAYIIVLGEKTRLECKTWRVRLIACVLSFAAMFGYVEAIQTKTVEKLVGLDTVLFTPTVMYRKNGWFGGFLANLKFMKIEKESWYTQEAAEELIQEQRNQQAGEELVKTEDMPNILVIMNEAFSDLSVYGDFNTSEEYMPFFNSLKEDTVRGNLYVSVIGGNTANTEFEFLTGSTMGFLPAGSIAYQQYIKGEMPSLASQLSNLGYTTAALHPYYDTGWNRNKIYPWFGFERMYFLDDFAGAKKLRGYVTDESAFDKLIELYEKKNSAERLFAFEVTMQNHGGYSKEYTDLWPEITLPDLEYSNVQTQSTEKYLTLIKKTDDAFKKFINYFSKQDEKTIVLMFGDHQPADYYVAPVKQLTGHPYTAPADNADELSLCYQVPFAIWANYDIDEKEVEAISANYLGGLLLDTAGLPKTGYQNYLKSIQEKELPVVTSGFYADKKDGELKFHTMAGREDTGDKRSAMDIYAMYQYLYLFEENNEKVERYLYGE